MNRPETIEETGDLLRSAGGRGEAVCVDHLDVDQVRSLLQRIEGEQGRLDILVNDIFGGDRYMEWDKPQWEHNLTGGLRMLRMGVDTHLITLFHAVPVMLRGVGGIVIEVTDGTEEFNANFRENVGFYYDLVKANVGRIVKGLAFEMRGHPITPLGVTPGWLRSERMLEGFGVSEENWRDALERVPGFAISESPTYLGRGIAALCGDLNIGRFAGTILTSRQLADIYQVTDMDGSRPDCWGMIAAMGIDYDDVQGIQAFR